MSLLLRSSVFGITMLFVLTACGGSSGGSSGSGENEQVVEINFASRCQIKLFGDNPDNCMPEEIEGDNYATDQNTIHLSGTASTVVDDGCPEPSFDVVICIPTYPFNYYVSWINSRNDASGDGEVAYLTFGVALTDQPVRWNTYDGFGVTTGYADPKGIPLELGTNTIQITTSNSGLSGNANITITRVVDVTPPTVHHVIPEPGGTYGSGIGVYFSEQLDPASVVDAIDVFDINDQPVAGTSEYDPKNLSVIWRPQSALSPASSYTARISGVTDWAPNVMIDPYEWSFTTRP